MTHASRGRHRRDRQRMLAPVVTVVGYETVGHRHLAAALLGN
jgi:hypothetical protein